MSALVPLLGKRILVPRGKKEAKTFSDLVEKYGGVPVEIPLLAFRPISLSNNIKPFMEKIHTYDWIIFTSNVTVETFMSIYQRNLPLPKIAVIGKKTEMVLKQKGFNVQFVPSKYVAEEFVDEFLQHVQQGMKILIPKGNLARDYIAESLTKAGALVEEIVVYETYLPEESKELLNDVIVNGQLEILTFTSPSTVDHFMEVINEKGLRQNINHCIISCIGPVTKERIESVGLQVDVIPKIYTVEDMLQNIVMYLQQGNE